MIDRIAVVSYESPYAPCGGITPVMRHLPAALGAASKRPTIGVTPFHGRLPQSRNILDRATPVGSVWVQWLGQPLQLRVLRYLEDWSWYLLQSTDTRIFAGRRHPYDAPDEGVGADRTLLRDSLIFGAAVGKLLPMLAPGQRWGVLMQDWQAATAALSLAADRMDHSLRLVLHNSYDAPLTDNDLWEAGIDSPTVEGTTVLQRASHLVGGPILTVSEGYARELTEDVLQNTIFAQHLQPILRRRGVVGIENGPFSDVSVPPKVIAASAAGQPGPLAAWKTEQRQAFIDMLDPIFRETREMNGHAIRKAWGDGEAFVEGALDERTPWFLLGGRDDPRQKGFDLAAWAVEEYLQSGRDGRFLFFPNPGDQGILGLVFLQRLAESDIGRGKVLVFPFPFHDGYRAAIRASSFGLMPSYYEPFGSASELALAGTPTIARATGGLTGQVVPDRQSKAFTMAVERTVRRIHAATAAPTGYLFREPDDLPSLVDDWQTINAAKYDHDGGHPDRLEQRRHLRLFTSMAHALAIALEEAGDLFAKDPEGFVTMVAAGIRHCQAKYSWRRTGEGYWNALRTQYMG